MKISPILVEPGQNTLPPFAQQMGTIMVSFSDLSEANQVRLEFVDQSRLLPLQTIPEIRKLFVVRYGSQ